MEQVAKLMLTCAFVGIELIAVYAYWPQVRQLITNKQAADGFSVQSWGLWSLSALIALAYSGLLNEDPYLVAVTLLDAIGVWTIFAFTLRHHCWVKPAEGKIMPYPQKGKYSNVIPFRKAA